MVENRRLYAYLLNENLILKNCPAILANSLEYNELKIKTQAEQQVMAKMRNNEEVKDLVPKDTQRRSKQANPKALVLIIAYLMRLEELENTAVDKELESILQMAPYHMNLMLEMGIMLAVQY